MFTQINVINSEGCVISGAPVTQSSTTSYGKPKMVKNLRIVSGAKPRYTFCIIEFSHNYAADAPISFYRVSDLFKSTIIVASDTPSRVLFFEMVCFKKTFF